MSHEWKYEGIQIRLKRKGLSIAEVCKECAISEPMLRHYARGTRRPSQSALQKAWEMVLAKAGLTLEQFARDDWREHALISGSDEAAAVRARVRPLAARLLDIGIAVGLGEEHGQQIAHLARELMRIAENEAPGTARPASS